MTPVRIWLVGAITVLSVGSAWAQAVYKCTSPQGKVIYSHDPCLGASVVDTTPTQGLDRSSGRSLKGADVQRAEQRRAMAEALKPLLGETPEQYETRHRRAKLIPSARVQCTRLDERLPEYEAQARAALPSTKQTAEAQLLEVRRRFRELRC